MATVFKYKTPVNRNYASGFVKPGLDGSVGNKGRSGNAVYFVDFDLDNSYDIEMALQKIEHNFILSNDSTKKLEGREYAVNDLLLSNSGKCYRIIESSQDSVFNNFKYDIEFLGAIKNNTDNNIKHVRIYDVTGLRFYSKKTGKLIKSYDPRQRSCWVNNRTEKPYSTDFYKLLKDYDDDEDFALYGAWLKMVAVTTVDDKQEFTNKDGLTGSSYSFSILLNSNKSYALNGFPTEYVGDPIELGDETYSAGRGIGLNFKKKLEFPNITVKPESFFTPTSEQVKNKTERDILIEFLFNEVTKPGANKKCPLCTTSYMSDYSMDSYHPFGNNIMCTLSADNSMWYKSGVGAREITENGRKIYKNVPESLELSENLNESISGGLAHHVRLGTINRNLEKYGAGLTFTQTAVEMIPGKIDYNKNIIPKSFPTSSEPLKLEWFPQYAASQSLSSANEKETQEELDQFTSDASTTSGLILYPTYQITSDLYKEDHLTNYKGGNSLFFSGIDKYEVPFSIFNFVTSTLNTYQCVIKSAATKEVVITDVPVLIDTSFRNKSYYISFEGDNNDIDDSFYNDPEDAENDDPTPPSNRDDENSDKIYKHYWSFKTPIHMQYVNGGNTITVYFITNFDETLSVSINESEDIIESVVNKQHEIFSLTLGEKILLPSDDLELDFDLKSKDPNRPYYAVPVNITANYGESNLIDTYVGIKLNMQCTAFEDVPVKTRKENVISESIVAYSNPELKPNVQDSSIDGIEEKPDDDRKIYKLTIKHIIGTNWEGQIAGSSYEDQAAEISEYYIAKTPYEITYTILNGEKYYFLEPVPDGETPDKNYEQVEIYDKIYLKKRQITFKGKLIEDTVIGDDVIIKVFTFDVSINAGNFINVKDPNSPVIQYYEIPYGTIIENLPDFYNLVNRTFERFEDNPDEEDGYVFDKDHFEYYPDESSIITKNTNVIVSAIPLNRKDITVSIVIYYPNGPGNTYTGGTMSTSYDSYKEFVTSYYPKFDSIILKHYAVEETYQIETEDGEVETKSSITISDEKGNTVPYEYDDSVKSARIKNPTNYGKMTVYAYASFKEGQEEISGIFVKFHDFYNNEDVENFIMPDELNQYGTQQKPIYVSPGDTIEFTLERRFVIFDSPSEVTLGDPGSGDSFKYRIPLVEGDTPYYTFMEEGMTNETLIEYNNSFIIKINEDAPSGFSIPFYNVAADETQKKWLELLIQTKR